ncbi:permease YjgP/YjgQ family protein [Vulgatibacter incomptus]|uniref:Permease YjgP/YjgQ family protein n=1 Tax=Vulgatibacter incomptus TaxID=1391653 RepID=A0A0K1PC45_9BACT|nr:permease YjgP/YjgQ family protein [Vulgatibacter incomptus]
MVPPFFGALLFFTQLFFVARMISAADAIFGSAVDLGDVVGVLVYLVPSLLSFAMPVAFLLGVLIGLGRLADDRELVALEATGHGNGMLLVTPVALGVFLTAVMLVITTWASPVSLKRAQGLMADLIRRNLANGVQPGVFYEDLSNLTVFAADVDKKTGALGNVLVEDARESGSPILVLARKGRIQAKDPSGAMVLHLEDGDLHRGQPKGGGYAVGTFAKAEVAVNMDREIWRKNSLDRRMENQTPADLKANYDYYMEKGEPELDYLVEFHRRFAHPFVMLSLSLVGVAVAGSATGKRKSGKALAISWTVAFLVGYFVIGKITATFGNRGDMPAWLAAWAPVLLMGAMGVGMLVWRRQRGGAA